MKTSDPIDRLIGSWLRDEALARAPIGQLERTLTAIDDRRSRPGWMAGLGAHWVGSGATVVAGAGRQRLRWSAVVALVLLAVGLLGGGLLLGAGMLQPVPDGPTPDFHLAYSLDGDVIVADWDGSNPHVVADGEPDGETFWAWGDIWSPDGRFLLYHGGSVERSIAYVSDPAGNVIASFPGWGSSWSPDGKRIATWPDAEGSVDIYGLDGERQASLALPPGDGMSRQEIPTWTSSGQAIVVTIGEHEGAAWALPLDGSPPFQLRVDGSTIVRPAFASDGRMAFEGPGIRKDSVLSVAEGDGTGHRAIVAAPGQFGPPWDYIQWLWTADGRHLQSAWSPASDRIAFIWNRFANGSSEYELRVVDVDTEAVHTVVNAGNSPIWPLGWSPEGERYLLAMRDPADADTIALWSVRGDGTDLRRLVDGVVDGEWQP